MDAAVFLPWSPKKSTLTHTLGCIHRMHTVHLQANCLTEESVHVRMHMCMHAHMHMCMCACMHMCMHPQLWKFSLDFREHTAEASLQSPLPAQETASAKTNTGWLCVHLCICMLCKILFCIYMWNNPHAFVYVHAFLWTGQLPKNVKSD